jgi:hypothetical protein
MKTVFLVYYDSRNGAYFKAFSTLEKAEKGALKWIDEEGGLNEDNWEKQTDTCYAKEGRGEYMNIEELDLDAE